MESKVLVLGGGGREHALVWHLKKTGYDVSAAPGSDAIAEICPVWDFRNFEELEEKIAQSKIKMLIVGPEKYLEQGIGDFFETKDVFVFGPSKKAAQLETSKSFAKDFCSRHSIPSASYEEVKSVAELKLALSKFSPPFVVKASGLAAGKGVWIGSDSSEAIKIGEEFLKDHDSLVIEKFIEGRELSVFYLIDGSAYSFLGAACDHKRLLDKNLGPNTGGMGAFSPPQFWSEDLKKKIENEVLIPSIEGLKKDGLYYRGFLFLGLMQDRSGELHLLEYNCRMGDPETQCVLPRLETGLVEAIESLHRQEGPELQLSPQPAMSVVLSSKAYPQSSSQSLPLPELSNPRPKDLEIFHAGTKKVDSTYHAGGGRIFSVVCKDETLDICRTKIYQWIEDNNLKSKLHYRNDIGVSPSTEDQWQK